MLENRYSTIRKKKSVAIIVTTYNQPNALNAVISSLKHQTHLPARIVIADDGSNHHTTSLIRRIIESDDRFLIQHAWQSDSAFRAARSRNLAMSKVSEEYIIFIDGDCLLPPRFVENHVRLAGRKLLVAGARLLLEAKATSEVLYAGFDVSRKKAFIGRKFLTLPLGPLRLLFRRNWARVRTCNLGIHTEDFLEIEGFDESYVGWGKEDSDLALRLLNAGIIIKDARYACCVAHLNHQVEPTDRLDINNKKLQKVIENNSILYPAKSSLSLR